MLMLMNGCASSNRSIFDLFSPKPVALDGFCLQYQKVIREKGEGSIQAKRVVKDRILANEERFRNECEPKPS